MKLLNRLEKKLVFALLGIMLVSSFDFMRHYHGNIYGKVKSHLVENYEDFKDKNLGEYSFPIINYASHERLWRVFKKENQKTFAKWEDEYGESRAKEIIDGFKKEVIGLFVPRTGELYVGDFLEPCRKRGIIGHELTHFLQESFGIKNELGLKDKVTYREMQAGLVEKMFMENCQ